MEITVSLFLRQSTVPLGSFGSLNVCRRYSDSWDYTLLRMSVTMALPNGSSLKKSKISVPFPKFQDHNSTEHQNPPTVASHLGLRAEVAYPQTNVLGVLTCKSVPATCSLHSPSHLLFDSFASAWLFLILQTATHQTSKHSDWHSVTYTPHEVNYVFFLHLVN